MHVLYRLLIMAIPIDIVNYVYSFTNDGVPPVCKDNHVFLSKTRPSLVLLKDSMDLCLLKPTMTSTKYMVRCLKKARGSCDRDKFPHEWIKTTPVKLTHRCVARSGRGRCTNRTWLACTVCTKHSSQGYDFWFAKPTPFGDGKLDKMTNQEILKASYFTNLMY